MVPKLEGRDWLLLLIASGETAQTADPIRIMKGAFLLSEGIAEHGGERPYRFRPYRYGPWSPEVYDDVARLVAEGLVSSCPAPHTAQWRCYSAQAAGLRRARELNDLIGPDWATYVKGIRRWLDGQTFSGLLRFIYRRFPAYATETVLPHLVERP